jgi:hypothetical protein
MVEVYKVKGKVWLWPGDMAAWHFVHVDKKTSDAIKAKHRGPRRGFGAVKVKVTIGKTSWSTSIFPDKKSGTYLLPIKAKVRSEEGIEAGDSIDFTLSIF